MGFRVWSSSYHFMCHINLLSVEYWFLWGKNFFYIFILIKTGMSGLVQTVCPISLPLVSGWRHTSLYTVTTNPSRLVLITYTVCHFYILDPGQCRGCWCPSSSPGLGVGGALRFLVLGTIGWEERPPRGQLWMEQCLTSLKYWPIWYTI